jgi:hypothetical protein
MLRNLEKHQKYKTAYRADDFYWGLGIEHETYIETSKLKQITPKELKENRGVERYSVNYYSIYNTDSLNTAIDSLYKDDEKILVPILINSHSFQKTDVNGEHETTFERIPKLNTNYAGKTIFQWMKEQNPDVFLEDYEKSYIFDGDTIEFMTQNFYKTTVQKALDELVKVEKDFMRALNSLPREGLLKTYGPFQLAQKNYGFASYLTNLKNNAMFNNGTIHINITLPTKLNSKAEVEDFELFRRQHQNLARAIQWISPLLIAKYGAYDPLCESKNNGERYAAGSQRVAVSRYIGLGTFDTDKMEIGKILTRPRSEMTNLDWYEEFHKVADYKYLNELGMDINFNKHFCHGIEFRILESIPIDDLSNIMHLLVYLCDFSLEIILENPIKSQLWHKLALECVHNGKGYCMDVSDQNELYKIFNMVELAKEPLAVCEVLHLISNDLHNKYKNSKCAKCMIDGEDVAKPEPKPESKPEPKPEPKPEIKIEHKPEIIPETSPKKTVETRNPVPTSPQIIIVSKKPRWMCC